MLDPPLGPPSTLAELFSNTNLLFFLYAINAELVICDIEIIIPAELKIIHAILQKQLSAYSCEIARRTTGAKG
jgi:hypothetical protein